MTNTNSTQAHVFISGRVQGVGFRFSTVQQAKRLGVNGWVRNLSDGRVEAVFEGKSADVEEMVTWAKQGPSSAVVQDIAVDYETPEGLQGFETRASR